MPRVCERHVFRIQVSECLIVNIVFRLEKPLFLTSSKMLRHENVKAAKPSGFCFCLSKIICAICGIRVR